MVTDTNKKVEVDWLKLPKELWACIANRLRSTTTVDLHRFRSTCSTWRSAAPPPPSTRTLFPPQSQIRIPYNNYTLLQTRIYRLQQSSISTPPDSSSSNNSKGWIIQIGDSKSPPFRLLNPFTSYRISPTNESRSEPPKLLNVVNFCFLVLFEAYRFHFHDTFAKAVLSPSSGGARMVFALYLDGKLAVSMIGGDGDDDDDGGGGGGWTFLDDGITCFDDVMVRADQIYALDKSGAVLWVDCSSLRVVQYSPVLCSFGKKKQLVERGGSMYVVDLYGEWEVVDVRVYRLDEEWGRWLEVKDLGDVVFVLGKDCNFSLDSRDYYGCEGNCVYFYSSSRIRAFSLETSKFKPSNIFWPCPSLFHPKFNL